MTNLPKWQDIRADVVAGAVGDEAVAEARHRNQDYIDGHRLAERHKALGRTGHPAALARADCLTGMQLAAGVTAPDDAMS